jgi:two-component system, OmpR family, sensor kinase
LIKDGSLVKGLDDEEESWSGIETKLQTGLHVVEHNGLKWQVLTHSVDSDMADQFAIVRPWSPSVRLVRTLILYQIAASIIVMGLAIVAVSFFSSRLAKPLEELREKTNSVGRNQVEQLSQSSVVEIAELQDSFLTMSHRVEEAMASQRRFVADASHELKTPLTAISGMLQLLQSRPEMEDEDRRRALSVAKKEADRMESLIADLLLLSRAQARRSGAKSSVRLATLVEEQTETLSLVFPEQVFQLEGDMDITYEINPGAFSRIARNLMENAASYAGGEPIQVRFDRQGEAIVFSVADSGPGIPEDKVSLLFERFYRTDAGRARTDGGHGLGLAIVKALVEEAGGTLSCRSEVGTGTEFIVKFIPNL